MRHHIVNVLEERRPAVVATFDDFYSSRYASAVRLAGLVTGSPQVAEEIAQEVFVDLFRRWSTIERPDG